MNTVRDFHKKAMQLAQQALIARHEENIKKAESLAYEAFLYEVKAVELVSKIEQSEPTRSILHRSAASLAYQAKKFKESETFIQKGLEGNPPIQVQAELIDLLQQVREATKNELTTKSMNEVVVVASIGAMNSFVAQSKISQQPITKFLMAFAA